MPKFRDFADSNANSNLEPDLDLDLDLDSDSHSDSDSDSDSGCRVAFLMHDSRLWSVAIRSKPLEAFGSLASLAKHSAATDPICIGSLRSFCGLEISRRIIDRLATFRVGRLRLPVKSH